MFPQNFELRTSRGALDLACGAVELACCAISWNESQIVLEKGVRKHKAYGLLPLRWATIRVALARV